MDANFNACLEEDEQNIPLFWNLFLFRQGSKLTSVIRAFGLLVFLLVFTGIVQLKAQHTNIMISQTNTPNEPTICLNTKNPLQLVAGANVDNVYLSSDGGLSWIQYQMSSSYGVWGDPCIVSDTAGNFYFFHLSNPIAGNWIDRIVCQKMSVFGNPWSDGSYIYLNGTKAQDKEWVAVDPVNNNIYCTWTQFDDYGSSNPTDSSTILFSRSVDGGNSWSPALRINKIAGDCIDEDNTVEGAVPAVGPNGEIYVSWMGPAGLVFDRSVDGGQSWMAEDHFITSVPGGWDFSVPGIFRCNGMPVTCCDISNGPYRGNIYINWSDQRNGPTDTDIWLVKSTDGGDTWSSMKRVNNDPPGKQQFFTWMTVDQATGNLWFVFYDRRNYQNNYTDVYMAVSTDGGETFINFKVSQAPFFPDASVFFGDYTNITAYNNIIRPIWTRLDNTDLSIYTAMVDPTIVGVEEEPALPFSLESPFPNPVSESTVFSYKIRRPCFISLSVVDMFGKEVAKLAVNEHRSPGRYMVNFDAAGQDLQPGVYYFLLKTDKLVKQREFVYIK